MTNGTRTWIVIAAFGAALGCRQGSEGPERLQPPTGNEHGTSGKAEWPEQKPGGVVGGGPAPIPDEALGGAPADGGVQGQRAPAGEATPGSADRK
jgi:hypothetical protein